MKHICKFLAVILILVTLCSCTQRLNSTPPTSISPSSGVITSTPGPSETNNEISSSTNSDVPTEAATTSIKLPQSSSAISEESSTSNSSVTNTTTSPVAPNSVPESILGGSELSSIVTAQNTTAMDAYKVVLQNDANFYSTNIKKELLLNDLQKVITDDESLTMTINQFAVIDLDNDGTPEILLSMTMGGYAGMEVLHCQSGTVYGYTFSNRQLGGPKSDGTYYFSGGAYDYGVGTISFDRQNYSSDSITYCNTNIDGASVEYFVDHQNATADEFNAAYNQWENKPNATFYDFTQSNIDMIFSAK